MTNFYTLEVCKKQNKPCFVVTIHHVMHSGVFFFNTLENANDFIAREKRYLEKWGYLEYNENGCTDSNIIKLIQNVLNDDNICICVNGRTYYKMIKIYE